MNPFLLHLLLKQLVFFFLSLCILALVRLDSNLFVVLVPFCLLLHQLFEVVLYVYRVEEELYADLEDGPVWIVDVTVRSGLV